MKSKKMKEALAVAEKWSAHEISDLIDVWNDHLEDLEKMGSKFSVHTKIAKKLNEKKPNKYPERSPYEIQDKIQYLKDTYRKMAKKKKATGSGTDDVTWMHFDKIHAFLGTRPSYNEEYADTSDTMSCADKGAQVKKAQSVSADAEGCPSTSSARERKAEDSSNGSFSDDSSSDGSHHISDQQNSKPLPEEECSDVEELIIEDEEEENQRESVRAEETNKNTKHSENVKRRFSVNQIMEKQALILSTFEKSMEEDAKMAASMIEISKQNSELLKAAVENQKRMLDLLQGGYVQDVATSKQNETVQHFPVAAETQKVRLVRRTLQPRTPVLQRPHGSTNVRILAPPRPTLPYIQQRKLPNSQQVKLVSTAFRPGNPMQQAAKRDELKVVFVRED